MTQYYTVKEAAKYIGITESGLRLRIKKGKVLIERRYGVILLSRETVELQKEYKKEKKEKKPKILHNDKLSIKMPSALKEEVRQAAVVKNVGISDIVRLALESYLQRLALESYLQEAQP